MGGGATHTLKTHNEAYSTPVRVQTKPNQTKLNETKPNETKKKNAISGKQKVSWVYSDDKKHLQHVIPAAYAVSYRAEPDKAGVWGCNPHSENT